MITTIPVLSTLELPLAFIVVGDHRRDPERLLLRGDDGGYYALCLRTNEVTPVIPDDEWHLACIVLPNLDLYVA
jgi:hypothetical protein